MHRTPSADRCPCPSCALRTRIDQDPIVRAAREIGRRAIQMRAEARAEIACAQEMRTRLVRDAEARRRGTPTAAPGRR